MEKLRYWEAEWVLNQGEGMILNMKGQRQWVKDKRTSLISVDSNWKLSLTLHGLSAEAPGNLNQLNITTLKSRGWQTFSVKV